MSNNNNINNRILKTSTTKKYPNGVRENHEMSHSEKLKIIDDELNAFYKSVCYFVYKGVNPLSLIFCFLVFLNLFSHDFI